MEWFTNPTLNFCCTELFELCLPLSQRAILESVVAPEFKTVSFIRSGLSYTITKDPVTEFKANSFYLLLYLKALRTHLVSLHNEFLQVNVNLSHYD